MASILDLMGHIEKQGEIGRQQGNERGLASLLSKGMTANPLDRQAMLAERAAIDPAGTMQVAGVLQQQDEDALATFGKLSTVYPSTRDPHMARQWAQAGVRAGMLPPEVLQKDFTDPADIEGSLKAAQAFAQAFGQAGGNTVQSRFVADDGRVLMVMRDGSVVDSGEKADRQMWLRDHPGMQPEIVGKDGVARPVMDGPVGGLIPAVIQQESGGNPNAVSPKGARGLMQVMPQTGQDPGFGVDPLRDGSPQENVRFGTDYLTAMMERYGDQQLALAAYNAGPGRVDEALRRAGGDPRRAIAMLPQETQQYVPSVLRRAGARPSEAQIAAEKTAAERAVLLATLPEELRLRVESELAAAEGRAGITAGAEIGLADAKRSRDAQDTLGLLDKAAALLTNATGSGAGAAADAVAGFFGASTGGAQATAGLKTIAGQLVSKMPRMEGPQSDKDVQLYKDMAGNLADNTLPVETRLAALRTIQDLNRRYANDPAGGDGNREGNAEFNGFRVLD